VYANSGGESEMRGAAGGEEGNEKKTLDDDQRRHQAKNRRPPLQKPPPHATGGEGWSRRTRPDPGRREVKVTQGNGPRERERMHLPRHSFMQHGISPVCTLGLGLPQLISYYTRVWYKLQSSGGAKTPFIAFQNSYNTL